MTNCYANCNDYRHPAPYDKAWLRNVVRVPGDALTLQRVYIDPTIDPVSAAGIVALTMVVRKKAISIPFSRRCHCTVLFA